MYNNISNDAKTALKSRVVTTTARITLTSNNQVIDGNNLVNVTITDQCYENGVIVGTAMSKEVEIELIDNNYDLADKEFSLEVGVLLPNNSYEYIPYGNFIVKDYQKIISSNHYRLIAYDYMDKFNSTFVDNNPTLEDGVTYTTPMTLQSFYQYVANQFGVSIQSQSNLPNANFSITTKPYFDGMSGRTVISRIAEMMGCFAKINRSNKIEMRLKTTTSEKFSRNEMNNSLERDNRFGPINVISLRLSQVEGENVTKRDESSISQYGETTLQIQDNPFCYTEALRLAAINAIYNKVDGFSYYPTTFNGKLIYLDAGDEVEVQDMETDTYYKTIILKQVLKIPSTRNSKFENKALTDTGLQYQFTPEQVRKDRRTEYIVDKQNGTITQLVETTETIVNESIPNLQAQIDGAIQFWNGASIPTLNNYPANEWTTEAERNNHRADIYTVIQDVQGELKQGKSYRFDKVGSTWQWVELTDNELSAVQALANSKAKVFYTTPTVPYNLGDLWLKDGKLYRCKTAKGASGSYSANDWEEAVEYTDDTAANLAQLAADAAQGTADGAVTAINNIKDTKGQAEGKYIYLDDSSDDTIISAKFNGETNQETRSGKNLLNVTATSQTINGVTFTVNDDKTITANGTATAQIQLYLDTSSYNGTIKETGDYFLSASDTDNSSTYFIQIQLQNADGGRTYLSSSNTTSVPLTMANKFRSYIIIRNGITVNNVVFKPQFEKSPTKTSYEPYGIMPSLDYPSEIENLDGKNLFDINKTYQYNEVQKTLIDYKINDNKLILTAIGTTGAQLIANIIDGLDVSKNYTLSFKARKTVLGTAGGPNIRIIIYGSNDGSTYTQLYSKMQTNPTLNTVYSFSQVVTGYSYYRLFIYNNTSSPVTLGEQTEYFDIQFEEGTKVTPYTPYNSLEIKAENNNLFDTTKDFISSNIAKNLWTITQIDTGLRLMSNYSSGQPYVRYVVADLSNAIGKTVRLKSDFVASSTNKGSYRIGMCKTDGSYGRKSVTTQTSGKEISYVVDYVEDNNWLFVDLFSNASDGTQSSSAYVDYTNIMLTVDDEDMTYIEHEHQMVYFPLEEGQKLYEGSYLADDGIHNKTRELKLAIADMNNGENHPGWKDQVQLKTDYPGVNNRLSSLGINFKSNITLNGAVIGVNNTTSGIIFLAKDYFNLTQTQWKEQYPDLIFDLQYELEEEEIIPYNAEQQAAWNKIRELHTYKNITNIYSDAYAEIEYAKDNGLDIYETKANANVKYTETVEKFAQQQITNESITNTVSQTVTTVANNYNELKTKFDDYAPKSDVISLQTSVNQVITNTYTKTEVNEKLIDGSVQKVSTTSGTFDSNGLTIEKTDAKTKGRFNETGITVMDATSSTEEELLFAGYDEELNETIVRTKNITVEKYLTLKDTIRMEYYENPVIGGHGVGFFIL